MQKARLDTERYLALYYPSALLTEPARVRVLDGNAELIDTLTLSSSAILANLWLSDDGFTPTALGVYTLVYEESDGAGGYDVVDTQELNVGDDPVTDIVLSATANQTFRLDDSIVGDTGSVVTLDIRTQADAAHEATLTATWNAAESVYKVTTTTPISAEGLYYLIWYDDDVLVHVQELLAFVPKGYEAVTLLLADISSGATVPYSGATIVVSQTDGTPVATTVTAANGVAAFDLAPGDYVASFQKAGITFTSNNKAFTVINPRVSTGTNNFALTSASFAAVFSVYASSLSTCLISATLTDMSGEPLRCVDVVVELTQGPSNFSGTGVFGTSKVFRTNANGYVEFELVRGITVTVAIVTHGWRRRITVPSAASANLLTLAATSNDVFDIIEVNIPDVPVRSL